MNLYTHFSVKKTIISYKVDVNRKYLKEKKKKANLWKHRDAKPCPKVKVSFLLWSAGYRIKMGVPPFYSGWAPFLLFVYFDEIDLVLLI